MAGAAVPAPAAAAAHTNHHVQEVRVVAAVGTRCHATGGPTRTYHHHAAAPTQHLVQGTRGGGGQGHVAMPAVSQRAPKHRQHLISAQLSHQRMRRTVTRRCGTRCRTAHPAHTHSSSHVPSRPRELAARDTRPYISSHQHLANTHTQ